MWKFWVFLPLLLPQILLFEFQVIRIIPIINSTTSSSPKNTSSQYAWRLLGKFVTLLPHLHTQIQHNYEFKVNIHNNIINKLNDPPKKLKTSFWYAWHPLWKFVVFLSPLRTQVLQFWIYSQNNIQKELNDSKNSNFDVYYVWSKYWFLLFTVCSRWHSFEFEVKIISKTNSTT